LHSKDATPKAKRGSISGPKVCPTPTKAPFDCQEGWLTWEEAWSKEKKEWCCRQEDGCPGNTANMKFEMPRGQTRARPWVPHDAQALVVPTVAGCLSLAIVLATLRTCTRAQGHANYAALQE